VDKYINTVRNRHKSCLSVCVTSSGSFIWTIIRQRISILNGKNTFFTILIVLHGSIFLREYVGSCCVIIEVVKVGVLRDSHNLFFNTV
jgi:hypothetical protein